MQSKDITYEVSVLLMSAAMLCQPRGDDSRSCGSVKVWRPSSRLSLVIGTTVYLGRCQQTFKVHLGRTYRCVGNEIADADQISRMGINESLEPRASLFVLQLNDVGEGDITAWLYVVFQRGVQVVVLCVK